MHLDMELLSLSTCTGIPIDIFQWMQDSSDFNSLLKAHIIHTHMTFPIVSSALSVITMNICSIIPYSLFIIHSFRQNCLIIQILLEEIIKHGEYRFKLLISINKTPSTWAVKQKWWIWRLVLAFNEGYHSKTDHSLEFLTWTHFKGTYSLCTLASA